MVANKYRDLIRNFVDGSFNDAEEFARTYDKIFLSEPGDGMDRDLFEILEDFWEDVDAYSPLWESEDIDEMHITESTLQEEALKAIGKLDKYIQEHPQ